jgi:IPT/TIG domain
VRDHSRETTDPAARGGGARAAPVRRAGLALAVALVALLAVVPSAPAVIVQVQGRALSYQPTPQGARQRAAAPAAQRQTSKGATPNGSAPLSYHSPGPVMPANTNYALYWDPAGPPSYPAGYQEGLNRYFSDLAGNSGGVLNSDSVLAQYGDSGGHFAAYESHFGGALADTNPYPANGCSAAPICLTDAQIRTEILSFVQAHALPIDLEHEYFLLTPEGVESCTEAAGTQCSDGTSHKSYCAYHSFIQVGGSVLVYADDPYVAGLGCDPGSNQHPNGNASDATIAGGLAHEHSESVTDPELNAWYDNKGNEVADKCQTGKAKTEFGTYLGTAPDGSPYNEVINGDLYLYQQMWSNEAHECRQRQAELPAIKKIKPKSGPPAGGTTVTITGTGFSSPATVRVGEAEATGVHVDSPTSITAVMPAGPASTKVYVTVTTPVATSPITKKGMFKYKSH